MKRILIHNLLRSAEKYPDRIAFKQMNNSLSYAELLTKSNQLAQLLNQLGIQKGDRVGIYMNRSLESAFAVYGTLMIGAAYVPIDSNLPAQRAITIINDCQIKVILTNNTFKKNIAALASFQSSLKHVIGINATDRQPATFQNIFSWEDVFSFNHNTISVNNKESDIAYIMYTSGTTGKPKGIVHTNYSGGSYAKLSAELYQLKHTDILGNHAHLHFDISTLGYLTMPYVGACTVIVPEAHTKFPNSLAKLIEEEALTIWYSVPVALKQLVEMGGLNDRKLTTLRWILFGGEIFAVKDVKKLMKLIPNANYSNVYGPAEVNQCTFYNFNTKSILSEPMPIGQAWPETDVQLINSNDGAGEIMVASSTQMLGYWNNTARTNESFVQVKYKNSAEKQYYKTGDIGYLNQNEELVFLGRQDRQVKIRGYRVELNEIENVLLQNDAIKEAAVFVKSENEALVIKAQIVVHSDETNISEVKKHLNKLLPSYSIPNEIVFVDALARTSAGKIDYKFLAK